MSSDRIYTITVTVDELSREEYALTSEIPQVELNSNDQVTAIDGHTIVGCGSNYTAGAGIDITNDEISVDSTVALKSDIPVISGTNGVSVEDNVVSLDNPVNLVAGDNVNITVSGDDVVISAQGGGASYTAGDYISINNDIIAVTGLQPSDAFYVRAGVTTHSELNAAYDAGKAIYAIRDNIVYSLVGYVTTGGSTGRRYYMAGLRKASSDNPKEITTFRIDTTNGSTSTISYGSYTYNSLQANWNETNTNVASYIQNKPSIPVVELNSSNQVTAIDGHTLAGGGGGTTYTAGDGIDITNDTISIDSTVALKSEIPDITNLATKSEVQAVEAEIPEDEEVDFEELDLADYALASAIPDVSTFATKAEVTTAINTVTGMIPDLSDLNTAGVTDIQVVQSLPASPVATILYLIPEA